MPPFIAIAHSRMYRPQKRDALLFDQISLLGFHIALPESLRGSPLLPSEDQLRERAELEWLESHGVVREHGSPLIIANRYPEAAVRCAEETIASFFLTSFLLIIRKDHRAVSLFSSRTKIKRQILSQTTLPIHPDLDIDRIAHRSHLGLQAILQTPKSNLDVVTNNALNESAQRSVRMNAVLARLLQGIDATPLGSIPAQSPDADDHKMAAVIRVTLAALPVPNDDTPWEQIIDFRQNDEARLSLRRLRHWMRSAATENMSEATLADELQLMLDNYAEHMRLHRMKYHHGVLETIVTAGAEIAESILKLKFATLAHQCFSVKADRIKLLEAEMSAPGREVAYIATAHEQFARGA